MKLATIVSRESIHLGFMISALNNLDILKTKFRNSYVNTHACKDVHTYIVSELFAPEHTGNGYYSPISICIGNI